LNDGDGLRSGRKIGRGGGKKKKKDNQMACSMISGEERWKLNLPSTLTSTESTADDIKTVGKALTNSVAARTYTIERRMMMIVVRESKGGLSTGMADLSFVKIFRGGQRKWEHKLTRRILSSLYTLRTALLGLLASNETHPVAYCVRCRNRCESHIRIHCWPTVYRQHRRWRWWRDFQIQEFTNK
jgi:hypothetical protein